MTDLGDSLLERGCNDLIADGKSLTNGKRNDPDALARVVGNTAQMVVMLVRNRGPSGAECLRLHEALNIHLAEVDKRVGLAKGHADDDDDIDIHIPKSLWGKVVNLSPVAKSVIAAGLLALGTGGVAGLRAFLNIGRATATGQTESRTATRDENETILQNVRLLIAEDRKANETAQEERTARIVAAALEKTKTEFVARQVAAQAEKDKKR